MPVFGDSNNIPLLLDPGDYVFTVTNFEIGISDGAKTRGSEKYEVELEIEPSGKKVTEFLIDHEKTAWKIDTFLKSAGVTLTKGEAFDFREDIANRSGIKFVNPIGLRGWCNLTVEELPKRDPKDPRPPLKVNKVAVFYTDRPKLPRRELAAVEEDRPF